MARGDLTPPDFVYKKMFELLQTGADRIAHRIGRADVLSLVGRALFFRFLYDRSIIQERNAKDIAPQAEELRGCFDNAENAFHTCQWLDRTFNGDFLPLTDGGCQAFFEGIAIRSSSVFGTLKAIVRGREPAGAADYQLKFDWGDFDFAHIPVGLLSQVYEAFCWKWEHRTAKETSVHYTPRNIAATVVEEAFDGLPHAHNCRVLDPACGAGVFLVLAFRRLYREHWKEANKRPDTKAIRAILEKQLVGFDISESALRLAALSLYLTAIELDPQPVPPEKLAFKALRDHVLFNHRRDGVDPDDRPAIGSLGPHVERRFDGQFHLVVSNPPWTSLSKKEQKLAAEMNDISREIVHGKDPALAKDYENPDSVPDLPFIWRSAEWCKPDGRIALVLPARTLFKQGEISRRARETLFRLIEVTGIINCSNLRKTQVWPEMDQPFMLLFARNRRPKAGQVLQFISPQADTALNGKGELRVDSRSVPSVEIETSFEEPWLWKALAVGTPLDVEVVRKIKAAGGRRLQQYWEGDLGLASSNGYQIKPGQKQQQDAKPLQELPDLDTTDLFRFVVDVGRLKQFARNTLFRTRFRMRGGDKLRVYRGPLALVEKSPSPQRSDGRALLCLEDVAYNQSFYGYSAAGHGEAELLVRYLQLFVHSQLWLHYALLTSAKLGVERPNVYKADLDDFPLIPLERLSEEQCATVRAFSQRLVDGDASVFTELDAFFDALYGLDHLDSEVIRDTLEVRDPHDELGKRGSTSPTSQECSKFRGRLERVVRPFFKVLGKEVQVSVWKPDDAFLRKKAPYGILLIGVRDRMPAEPDKLFRDTILQLADDTGATRVIQQVDGGLLVGILNQYRYWTPSRARLLGAEIVRQYMGVFED